MNNLFLKSGARTISLVFSRNFASSGTDKNLSCKVLILGGGTGGCTMAAKLSKHAKTKDSIVVLDANQVHYYQPLWTLVGAGVSRIKHTRRDMKAVLPSGVRWVQDYAEAVLPEKNIVQTLNGRQISYEYLIFSVGLNNDYAEIPGLCEALDDKDSGVSTIYAAEYCEKTFSIMQKMKSGNAVFTFPHCPIKCPGAPLKIAFLADSYFSKTGVRDKINMMYNSYLPVIFGVPKYAKELLKVAKRKNLELNYQTVLTEVDAANKTGTFLCVGDNKTFKMKYDMLHVTPPMRTPPFLKNNKELATDSGYLDVDKYTLQHTTYKNIFGLGDCTNTPNSKTAAAVAKQSFILEMNLLNTMMGRDPLHHYDGYGACPLVTSYSTCILAEFLYDGVIHETMPFDQESRLAYYMKRFLFPKVYWNLMLKGNYNGPEFIRRIINPFAK